MKSVLARLGAVAVCAVLAASLMNAQEWKAMDSYPGVDLTRLTSTQKTAALKLLREHACSCGCGRTVAQCRVEDPSCSFSVGMAHEIVAALAQGKTEQQALDAADTSRYGANHQQELLDPAVSIPTTGSPVEGPANAPITLVEFSDFQCPYCTAAVPQLKALLAAYPTKVKLVFKEFPLETHPQADLAAAAALAAQKQGKFWQLHDAMYSSRDLSRPTIRAMAEKIGLDMKQFDQDWDSSAVREAVVRDVQDGDKAGVEGTPTLFINGQKLNAAIHIAVLKPVVEAALKGQPVTTANLSKSVSR